MGAGAGPGPAAWGAPGADGASAGAGPARRRRGRRGGAGPRSGAQREESGFSALRREKPADMGPSVVPAAAWERAGRPQQRGLARGHDEPTGTERTEAARARRGGTRDPRGRTRGSRAPRARGSWGGGKQRDRGRRLGGGWCAFPAGTCCPPPPPSARWPRPPPSRAFAPTAATRPGSPVPPLRPPAVSDGVRCGRPWARRTHTHAR